MPERSTTAPGRLVVVHSADPGALLAHAAAPFCVEGRVTERLPLLAVRQGGIRDQLQERAARAGCVGWLGAPVVVFGELPELFAGPLAPLSRFERRARIESLLDRVPLPRLGAIRSSRGAIDTLDRLFGDLTSERVAPNRLTSDEFGADAWERDRDGELAALYAAYLGAVAALPPIDGIARSDGRDGRTIAAEVIRERPDDVRARLRRPFASADDQLTVAIYGLNDLRRGWDRLLDALLGAPFVAEVRVYLALDELDTARAGGELDMLGEHELLAALLTRGPGRFERVGDAGADARGGAGLASLRATLFRAGRAPLPHDAATPVRAVAVPDIARELETVARRIKELVVERGVAPHRIAVVSRKSRPYGPRAADVLRRFGLPVTARLRSNLAEVSAVAALLRVFRAAAEGWSWRTLGELGESPYFDVALDVALLRRVAGRSSPRSLDAWTAALEALADEAAYEANSDEYRGPDAARARRAVDLFAAFREVADTLVASRTRAGWIALARHCIGRGGHAELEEGLWGLCRNACRVPHDDGDSLVVESTRRDAEALSALADLLAEWRDALPLQAGQGDESLSPRDWYRELADSLGDVEITLSTPHRRGVHVLEASAAVWRTFDHLFVVGMTAGEFPADPQGRELFGEHERAVRYARGLPLEPADVWFAREASLFRALVSAARRSLHLSYPFADAAGSAQIPSAYFDEVVNRYAIAGEKPHEWVETIPGSRVAPPSSADAWSWDDLQLFAAANAASTSDGTRADARMALAVVASEPDRRAILGRALAAAAQEHDRRLLRAEAESSRARSLRPWNGHVTSPDLVAALDRRYGDDAVWSASQLESYGRCPFTFFARYVLDLRGVDVADDEEMDGATRGQLVHICLDRLHSALASDLGDGALGDAAIARGAKLVPQVVSRALGEMEKTGRPLPPALRAAYEREMVALVTDYLAWEVAENAKTAPTSPPRRRPLFTEYVFGMDGRPAATLVHGGRTLRLRGKIDRVDESLADASRGQRYVVDHKTGESSLKPVGLYEHGAILQLPLYMHALDATADRGAGVWGGAYQIVKNGGSRTAMLHHRAVKKDGKPTDKSVEAADRLQGALEFAFIHRDGILAGEFPARIPPCNGHHCPPYCDMRDVCREDRPGKGAPKR